jgi:hypothetical protein
MKIILYSSCLLILVVLSESFQPKFTVSRISKLAMASSTSSRQKAIYPFHEARNIARGHGFDSKEEFLEYSCPGAYQLPKNPQEVWSKEWKGWDDWLGVCWGFSEGREISRGLNLKAEKEYLKLFESKQIQDDSPERRLPYRPDLKYKSEWEGWDDWLGC